MGYSHAGCALLVAVDDEVFALTYGTVGRHFIDLELARPGFGVAFAVRSIEPSQISRIKRQLFGLAGRIDRNLVYRGQHIRHFGIDKWGEIVGQVSGKLTNPNLTVSTSHRSRSIVGANSLQIALGTSAEDLLSDLREISRVCREEAPDPDLEFITQITPVPAGDPRLPALNDRLDDLLGSDNPEDVGISVPADCVEAIDSADKYDVRIPYSGIRKFSVPEVGLDSLLVCTQRIDSGRRLAALERGRIAVLTDGDDEVAGALANKWLVAQLPAGADQMLYLDGHWFQIGEHHRRMLGEAVAEILRQPPSVTLPAWTSDLLDEDAYNRHVAKNVSGFVLLDKKLLRTQQHSAGRGIEACDLLGPGMELIHVKRADSSGPLSHLFAQGTVSVDALTNEADARQLLIDRVHQQRPEHPINREFRPRKVIYAIALTNGKTLSPANMFTFAQVALYRATKALRNENIDVEVIAIPSQRTKVPASD